MTLRLRFLLDEGVPHSVGKVLENAGHEVIYLHEAVARGSSDDLVVAAALENQAILVAVDRDMRSRARQHGISNTRYRSLNLLHLGCVETQAANRVEQALQLIESEWMFAGERNARRLFVELHDSRIVTNR
ncbi:MAG: DUF5615 family PIN-like protein [Rubellimicrobium sp.]|nr:DUF5615 family PIN-like protein [Rubellimicrobium sp.]